MQSVKGKKNLQKRCKKLISELIKVNGELNIHQVFSPFNLIRGEKKKQVAETKKKVKIKNKQDLLVKIKKVANDEL
jgi:hypothetical protein